MKEVYLQIQEQRDLLRKLYRLPKTPYLKQRIRNESRLLGELEHQLTLFLRSHEASSFSSPL